MNRVKVKIANLDGSERAQWVVVWGNANLQIVNRWKLQDGTKAQGAQKPWNS